MTMIVITNLSLILSYPSNVNLLSLNETDIVYMAYAIYFAYRYFHDFGLGGLNLAIFVMLSLL